MNFTAISWKRLVILCLGTAAAFFIFLRTIVSATHLMQAFGSLNTLLVLLAMVIILPTPVLSSVRWYALLRAAGHRLRFRKVAQITTASMAFIAVPGRLGDFVRAYPLRHEISTARTTATIVGEKILDIAMLCKTSSICRCFSCWDYRAYCGRRFRPSGTDYSSW